MYSANEKCWLACTSLYKNRTTTLPKHSCTQRHTDAQLVTFYRTSCSSAPCFVYILDIWQTLLSKATDKVHLTEESETRIYLCWYSKDVHRTKCQAIKIARLSHSPYTTHIARVRCYTMLSTIFKCQDVHHTISVKGVLVRKRGVFRRRGGVR